jgi:hypothetical protein
MFAGESRAAELPGSVREFYDLRTYHFASAEKQQAFEKFLAEAAIPAFNRIGITPIGVFKRLAKENPEAKLEADPLELWVLLPHKSLESIVTFEDRLSADDAFQKAAAPILTAPKSDPAFTRYENMLLLAMEKFPRLAQPSKAEGRLFELRTYESPNQERAKNKLEMFNAGEFTFFEQANMRGVFYGGAFAGADLPQLTYMVMHENDQDVKKHWADFSAIPEWKTLKSGPQYKDNVSKIIDRFVRPVAGSQI